MIACAQFDREAREIQSLGEIARSPLGHQKNFQIRREKKIAPISGEEKHLANFINQAIQLFFR